MDCEASLFCSSMRELEYALQGKRKTDPLGGLFASFQYLNHNSRIADKSQQFQDNG